MSLSTDVRSWLEGGIPTALSSSYVVYFEIEMWLIWSCFKVAEPCYSTTNWRSYLRYWVKSAFLLSTHVNSIWFLTLVLFYILSLYWLFIKVVLLPLKEILLSPYSVQFLIVVIKIGIIIIVKQIQGVSYQN